MAAKRVFVASENFACQLGEREIVVTRGERFVSGHPIVKGREHLFTVEGEPEPAAAAPRASTRKA